MQMDARTGFAQLRISPGPFGCSFKIFLKAFLSIRSRNIKVDDDMLLRNPHVMKPRRIKVGQRRADIFPFIGRGSVLIGILCRASRANIIQKRVLLFELDP